MSIKKFPCDYSPTTQTASHSKLPQTTVTCHSGTMFNDCCSAKTRKAATCKGMLVKKPSQQSPVLLGSAGGQTAPMSACEGSKFTSFSFACNTTAGSTCVYISGGLFKTPLCTCNTVADCHLGKGVCQVYTPTMPKNYKGKVCVIRN